MVKQACDTCTLLWFFFHIFLRRPCTSARSPLLLRSAAAAAAKRLLLAGWTSLFRDSIRSTLFSTHSTDLSRKEREEVESKQGSMSTKQPKPNNPTRSATPEPLHQYCSTLLTTTASRNVLGLLRRLEPLGRTRREVQQGTIASVLFCSVLFGVSKISKYPNPCVTTPNLITPFCNSVHNPPTGRAHRAVCQGRVRQNP